MVVGEGGRRRRAVDMIFGKCLVVCLLLLYSGLLSSVWVVLVCPEMECFSAVGLGSQFL